MRRGLRVVKFWRKSPLAARGSLRSIDESLARIADALEYICAANFGYQTRPKMADTTGEAPDCLYTDEEMQAVAEIEAELRARAGKTPEEE